MKILQTLALILGSLISLSAACDKLRSVAIQDTTQTSATITWKDSNTSITGYQLAYGTKGGLLKDATKLPVVNQKLANLTNLNSGTAYTFWIRTICATNDTSKWEGPFTLITLLSNPSRCNLGLEITDNSCKSPKGGDEYTIEVTNVNSGQNIYLESVSLIISHTWPADLTIRLENPQGKSIVLSKENGTLTDDFGIVANTCDRPCIFSASACNSIKAGSPPFEGNFEPEESLQTLFTTNPNGRWKLKICDGAINDKGILHYVALKFSPIECKIVENYYVSTVTDKSFDVLWTIPENCNRMVVYYKQKSETKFEKFESALCTNGKLNINNLLPDTEYDYYLVSNCGGAINSSPTCIRSVRTLCAPPILGANLDNQVLCDIACNVPCKIAGVFGNDSNDELDWILNEGGTPTDFTGPDKGIYEGGKYIYLESNPSLCGANNKAILESKCLRMRGNASNCDISFFHHMYGKDIGELTLKKSIDNGQSWQSIYTTQGDQGNKWTLAQLSFDVEINDLFKIRFEGSTRDGVEGDMALDQISILSASLANENLFYADKDGDGFGVTNDTLRICTTSPPVGYAIAKGDCNDNDASINPGKMDVPCNLVDENCDGKLELKDTANPMSILSTSITNETCKGKKDGKIKVEVDGGTKPYLYKWNNEVGVDSIVNLTKGFYVSKITDANGCGIESDIIEVKTISSFDVIVESIQKPSCKGVANGAINVKHNGLYPPFQYQWSNGMTTQNITNIKDGTYKVAVKDDLGCESESSEIIVSAVSTLNAVNSFKKQPFCYGDSTGILDFDVISGLPPFKYLWEDGYDKKRREKLPAGNYKITIADAQNCNTELTTKIFQPDTIQILITNIEEVRCFGNATGQIKLKIAGGTEPYDFQWSDGNFLQNRNNLKAGSYKVTVSDSNGCKNISSTIRINQSDSLYYIIDSIINASCLKKSDGHIYTSIFGGLPPYKYYWSDGTSSNNINDFLLPMNYTLTVVDDYNCKLTTDAIPLLNKNLSYPVDIAILKNVKCPNTNDASIAAKCEKAKPPLDFNWSLGVQNKKDVLSDTLTGLGSGIYNVTITDAESCVSISSNIELLKIPSFNALIDAKNNVCNSDSNGLIKTKLTGGSKPYKYQWSNGNNADSIAHLKNGLYAFTISDNNGCLYESQPITITSVSDIKVFYTSQAANPGKEDGKLIITPQGGKGQYTITWDDPLLSGSTVSNLKAGKYFFTVEDELNCVLDTFAIVDQVNGLEEGFENNLSIAPNPFVDQFIIHSPNPIIQLSIFTLTGQAVNISHTVFNDKGIMVDLSNHPSGIYVLDIKLLNHSQKILLHKL